MNIQIEKFSKGKNEERNEDYFNYDNDTFVLADGATDKNNSSFGGKSGGELISKLIAEETLKVKYNGKELAEYLTTKASNLYKEINPQALDDGSKRFSSTLICVRILNDKILITQIGDTSFRINGKEIYKNDKLIDELNAKARSNYIIATGDIEGGREYIMPLLKNQHIYLNNPISILGYGFIDGTEIPEKFIKTFEFNLKNIQTIELISEGYFSLPNEVSIQAYEREYLKVENEDPYKYKKYLSTKSSDDRTVVIIKISK
jgi:hypothetical protein